MKTNPLIRCVQCEDICRDAIVKVVVSFHFPREKNLKNLSKSTFESCFILRWEKKGRWDFLICFFGFLLLVVCLFFFFFDTDFIPENLSPCGFFSPVSSALGLIAVFRLQKYAYPCFEEVGCFWYFTIRTNGYFPPCVIMQFIDLKKSQWTWQVLTSPDTANSLLSFIFRRRVTLSPERPSCPPQLVLLPQLCMRPLPSFPIELWQPVIVCLSGYYGGNLLTWMLADPKISFLLCFLCTCSPTQVQNWTVWVMTRNESLQRLVMARIFSLVDGRGGANDRF